MNNDVHYFCLQKYIILYIYTVYIDRYIQQYTFPTFKMIVLNEGLASRLLLLGLPRLILRSIGKQHDWASASFTWPWYSEERKSRFNFGSFYFDLGNRANFFSFLSHYLYLSHSLFSLVLPSLSISALSHSLPPYKYAIQLLCC